MTSNKKGEVVNEKGHFLNEKQKRVKGRITKLLIDELFLNIQENMELFEDPQHVLDLIFSVLVMFNREVLIHTFKAMELTEHHKEIISNLFDKIKEEINEKIVLEQV